MLWFLLGCWGKNSRGFFIIYLQVRTLLLLAKGHCKTYRAKGRYNVIFKRNYKDQNRAKFKWICECKSIVFTRGLLILCRFNWVCNSLCFGNWRIRYNRHLIYTPAKCSKWLKLALRRLGYFQKQLTLRTPAGFSHTSRFLGLQDSGRLCLQSWKQLGFVKGVS